MVFKVEAPKVLMALCAWLSIMLPRPEDGWLMKVRLSTVESYGHG
jgi:hypothetical protein